MEENIYKPFDFCKIFLCRVRDCLRGGPGSVRARVDLPLHPAGPGHAPRQPGLGGEGGAGESLS